MNNNPVWKELISKKGQMDLKAPFSGKNVPSLISKDKSASSSPKNFKQSFMKNDQNAFKYSHNSKLSGKNVAKNLTQTQGSPIHNNFNNSTKVDKYEKILTPNIRKSVKDEENVKYSPDSQKVKDLHKKLRNVSNTKKLGETLTIYNAVNFNTFQQRLDKYSQSPERNINRSQDKVVKDLSQAAAKNEKYEKFMKRMEDSQDDQKRTMDANQAIKEGSDCLIIGRPITKGNPKENIKRIYREYKENIQSILREYGENIKNIESIYGENIC